MDLSPDLLNGIGTVGVVVAVGFMLITGKGLATQRELKFRDETIQYQRARIEELITQNTMMMREQGPAVTEALAGIRRAAENQ